MCPSASPSLTIRSRIKRVSENSRTACGYKSVYPEEYKSLYPEEYKSNNPEEHKSMYPEGYQSMYPEGQNSMYPEGHCKERGGMEDRQRKTFL